jgi:Lon protease-like protein
MTDDKRTGRPPPIDDMPNSSTEHISLFPLNTVLFPDGLLPLKIFEQRYLEMTKRCLRDETPFGVCLIREGAEVGVPAVPAQVGCLARIAEWDMPQLGMFHLLAQGTQRFRVVEYGASDNGLISATVELLPVEPGEAPRESLCVETLRAAIDKLDARNFPSPHRFDDAAWVGYRLTEAMPIPLEIKQSFLEMTDPHARLAHLAQMISDALPRADREA